MPRQVKKKRKDGLYIVNVYIGRVDGKSKYKSVYGKTQKEVNKKAEEIRTQLGRGINVNAANDTFEKWSELWLDNKSVAVSQSRLNTCKTHLAKLSPLYNYEIVKIKTTDIQKIINDLCRKNPTTGKPASKDLLKCVKNTASQIFATAINNRVLDYNPADAVTIPTKAEETTRTALTDEQISWIINTPHRAQLPAMIMLYAGLRRGEVLALTWSDVHLKTKTISVNKSVEMINGKPQIKKGGKTDAATRTVKIPDILVSYLDDAYNHFKDSIGKNVSSVLVCPNTQGQVMSSSSWESLWLSYMRDLNLKYGDFPSALAPKTIKKYVPEKIPMVIDTFTAHQLRHTFATILYKSGIDILTAKDQLGHSDIKTTLEIYTHLDKEFKSQSMDQLNDFIDKTVKSKMIDS